MWSRSLAVLVMCIFSFSNGFNITEEFEKIALPGRFIDTVQSYITNDENKISDQCKLDFKQYIKAFLKLKPWAWLMFDAGTKIPSGILSGNFIDLGQFDQCLNVENKITEKSIISGKYCLGSIPLPSPETVAENKIFQTPETRMITPAGISNMFATCLPSSCSTNDIQGFYSWMGAKFFDSLCQSKSTQLKLAGGDIATISFLSVIFCIMLVSTAYDVLLFHYNKKPGHSLLIAFSVLSNGKKLIATSKSSAQIPCLSGIRVLSMMWVMLGHRYSLLGMLPLKNLLNALRWKYDEKSMFIMGGTVSVDTFLVVGGLLVSYCFMTAMAKGVKFNIIMFYIHRYLRLTPVLAVIILIYVTILKHLGSGPMWINSMQSQSAGCEKYWWSTLLYVQNYVNPEMMCVNQSWYLSVDMQLFVLSPLILLPLKKWPRVGLIATAVLLFASILASFLIAWFDELYGLQIANPGIKVRDYMHHYYLVAHTRAGPWLMGVMLGYWIYEIKQNHRKTRMNKVLALISWAIALTILCACVYTGHNTFRLTYEYDRVANSFYVALLRPGWALGVCWVIFACVIGYGGPVNWFLSLPMFQVVAKFTYSMYLIHGAMQMIVSFQTRTGMFFTDLDMLYIFWGDFAFTLATSIIFTLAFESPIITIEKVIFGTGKEKSSRSVPSAENEKKKLKFLKLFKLK